MNIEELKKLINHYAILAQMLDGYWFLEIEKKYGFEAAYEIDDAVWKVFSKREGQKLQKLLGFETPTFEDIKQLLNLSIFDQSLTIEMEKISNDPLKIQINVPDCKTYHGMKRVGRPEAQIYKICKGIGISFFENLLKSVVPQAEVICNYCPYGQGEEKPPQDGKYLCSWEFILHGIK